MTHGKHPLSMDLDPIVKSVILVGNSFSHVLEMMRQRLWSFQSIAQFFSVTSLVTTSWLTDSQLHRLFGYLKLLVPNGEGDKTNVSVRYLGCWGWIAARSWEQDRGCFLPYGRFSVVLSFLDCLHPPLIAACRINNQSSKAGNKISHAQPGTKTQLYLW